MQNNKVTEVGSVTESSTYHHLFSRMVSRASLAYKPPNVAVATAVKTTAKIAIASFIAGERDEGSGKAVSSQDMPIVTRQQNRNFGGASQHNSQSREN